jgi:hypothetical protein
LIGLSAEGPKSPRLDAVDLEYTMKRLIACLAVFASIVWASAGTGLGAPQTWTGFISDSTCGGDHGGEVDVRECTLKCTRQGDKYVLATENGSKVIPIANQDFAALPEHAGHTVRLTGELKDNAIVISKIEMR